MHVLVVYGSVATMLHAHVDTSVPEAPTVGLNMHYTPYMSPESTHKLMGFYTEVLY